MDAAGHLKRYGWQGVGHSLDLGGKGLVKPLLVSHKSDNRGIGQKKSLVSDQWWMRAFDESLKELGTGNKVRFLLASFDRNFKLTLSVFRQHSERSRRAAASSEMVSTVSS
jgi:hypothetical protein